MRGMPVVTHETNAARIPSAPRRRPQSRVVAVAVLLLVWAAAWIGTRHGARHAALLLVGALGGLALHHAAFGFTTAFRRLVVNEDGQGIRAQMLMLAVATVLFAPILAAGELAGAGMTGAVAPAGLAVLLGALIFSVGMQLGGG